MISKTPVFTIFKLYWLYCTGSYTILGDPTQCFASRLIFSYLSTESFIDPRSQEDLENKEPVMSGSVQIIKD